MPLTEVAPDSIVTRIGSNAPRSGAASVQCRGPVLVRRTIGVSVASGLVLWLCAAAAWGETPPAKASDTDASSTPSADDASTRKASRARGEAGPRRAAEPRTPKPAPSDRTARKPTPVSGAAPARAGDAPTRPASSAPAPVDPAQVAGAAVATITDRALAAQRLLRAARREGEFVRAACYDDKLNQMNATLRSARLYHRLIDRLAEVARSSRSTRHALVSLNVLLERSAELMRDARDCDLSTAERRASRQRRQRKDTFLFFR